MTELNRTSSLTATMHEVKLVIVPQPAVTADELIPLFETWQQEFGLPSYVDCVSGSDGAAYVQVALQTRRMFALLPVMLRKAQRLGYGVGIWAREARYVLKDGGLAEHAPYEDIAWGAQCGPDHTDFWRVLALAQTWYDLPAGGKEDMTPEQRAARLAAMPLRPGETQAQRDSSVQEILHEREVEEWWARYEQAPKEVAE